MVMTATDACQAMIAHHAQLRAEVEARVGALRRVVDGGFAWEPAVAELVAYFADEVIPHALAEETTIYAAAALCPELAGTVSEMIAEHRSLVGEVEGLASTESRRSAADDAAVLAELFARHVGKENDILLPALSRASEVDLSGLLGEMQRLTTPLGPPGRSDEVEEGSDSESADLDAALLTLLLRSARGLAGAGQTDQACRLAAEAWRTVRAGRPDLAARVTAVLHGLARDATTERVVFRSVPGAASRTADHELDVRPLAPAGRHEAIFAAYGELEPGTGLLVVNDHDPKPLFYQFEAEHTGEFSWDYVEMGPHVWRVRIGRAPA
jgi:uncharacterized protein (DUF2249 family)